MNLYERIRLSAIGYRTALEELEQLKHEAFQCGATVQVDAPQYHGKWRVTIQDGTPPDNLAVRISNGNTWFYPVDCCRVVNDEPGQEKGGAE